MSKNGLERVPIELRSDKLDFRIYWPERRANRCRRISEEQPRAQKEADPMFIRDGVYIIVSGMALG